MKRVSAFVGVALLALAGCTTSKEQYAAMQTDFRSNPKLTMARCVKGLENKPASEKELMAALMGVSTKSVTRVFCRRVLYAVSTGRITYAEFVATERGNPSPNVIRMVQGRR